jgi:hypothetical protein
MLFSGENVLRILTEGIYARWLHRCALGLPCHH